MKNIQNSGLFKLEKTTVVVFFAWFTLYSAAALETRSDAHAKNIAIYRGKAGCAGCPERVTKDLSHAGLKLNILRPAEDEKFNAKGRCRICQVSSWQRDGNTFGSKPGSR